MRNIKGPVNLPVNWGWGWSSRLNGGTTPRFGKAGFVIYKDFTQKCLYKYVQRYAVAFPRNSKRVKSFKKGNWS